MFSLKALHSEIQSIKTKLLTQGNTSSAILNRLETLSSDITMIKKENAVLKIEIDYLRNKISYQDAVPRNPSLDQFNIDIVHELRERNLKCRKIIIFNVK